MQINGNIWQTKFGRKFWDSWLGKRLVVVERPIDKPYLRRCRKEKMGDIKQLILPIFVRFSLHIDNPDFT